MLISNHKHVKKQVTFFFLNIFTNLSVISPMLYFLTD